MRQPSQSVRHTRATLIYWFRTDVVSGMMRIDLLTLSNCFRNHNVERKPTLWFLTPRFVCYKLAPLQDIYKSCALLSPRALPCVHVPPSGHDERMQLGFHPCWVAHIATGISVEWVVAAWLRKPVRCSHSPNKSTQYNNAKYEIIVICARGTLRF